MTHTPGPWKVFVNDSGGEWTGWPMSINAPSVHEDCVVVRTGGQYPYAWDYRVSQAEAVANAHLIAAAPDMLEALEEVVAITENLPVCPFCGAVRVVQKHRPDCLSHEIDSVIQKARGEE